MSTTKTTADEKKNEDPFDEYLWMEREEEVDRECEEEVWAEEFRQLELDEMLEEEEEIREGDQLSKVIMNGPPVLNGDVSKEDHSAESESGKHNKDPFNEYLWMEHEEEINQECQEEIWEEELQQLELDEMLEEEEEIREGDQLSKIMMNGSPVINGDVSKEDNSAESESGKDNQ